LDWSKEKRVRNLSTEESGLAVASTGLSAVVSKLAHFWSTATKAHATLFEGLLHQRAKKCDSDDQMPPGSVPNVIAATEDMNEGVIRPDAEIVVIETALCDSGAFSQEKTQPRSLRRDDSFSCVIIYARSPLTVVMLTIISLLPCYSRAQSAPTASQEFQLSAFLLGTRTSTDLQSGNNIVITPGIDLALLAFRSIDIAAELRGSYPLERGTVSSQESILVGPKIEYPFKKLRPYINFLSGRGRVTYLNGGYIFGDFRYIRSDSLVLSPGAGVSFSLTHRTALNADFQYQYWQTPATFSGEINPRSISIGGNYDFDFNTRHLR
jgi:hypothetical protein